MRLRKKSAIDVIDLTKLQEKGILQRSLELAARDNNENLHSSEIIDLRNMPSTNNVNTNSPNILGFLDNLASVNVDGGINNLEDDSNFDGKLIDNLRIKIDDLEYKLDRLIDRLCKIEKKLS